MLTVADTIDFLGRRFPLSLAEDWDNTGLLVGRSANAVKRVMTCLTLTSDVAEEAIQSEVQLVVTHHPVLFRGRKQITDSTDEGGMLLRLIENGIAVYSPHTAFDSAGGGVNQQLAESFGLTGIQPVRPVAESSELGGGRWGTLTNRCSVGEFLHTVRTAVAAPYLEFCGSEAALVSKVAIACGAAGEFLGDAMSLGCDTFITGEARFHAALEARSAGMNLILLGHYCSERPAIEQLATILRHEFTGIDVWASRVETDPWKVFKP